VQVKGGTPAAALLKKNDKLVAVGDVNVSAWKLEDVRGANVSLQHAGHCTTPTHTSTPTPSGLQVEAALTDDVHLPSDGHPTVLKFHRNVRVAAAAAAAPIE